MKDTTTTVYQNAWGILGNPTPEKINEYKNSKSHNDIIKQKGDGEYGSSTMYIITEKKISNGKWEYEVMIRNLIIFAEPIN